MTFLEILILIFLIPIISYFTIKFGTFAVLRGMESYREFREKKRNQEGEKHPDDWFDCQN